MAQSYAKLYLHVIFATKYRVPSLVPEIQPEVYKYCGGICKKLGCMPIKIGGYLDHAHLFCSISRTISVAYFVQIIKQSSSTWIKTLGNEYKNFSWQRGYGAFSVSYSGLQPLTRYIINQNEHHKKITLKEEYISWLKKYDIDFDERYLFD